MLQAVTKFYDFEQHCELCREPQLPDTSLSRSTVDSEVCLCPLDVGACETIHRKLVGVYNLWLCSLRVAKHGKPADACS